MTDTRPDTPEFRREVLRTLCDYSERENLPMPMGLYFHTISSDGGLSVDVRLADESRTAVDLWAEATGNGDPVAGDVAPSKSRSFIVYRSERWAHDGPTWLGLGAVEFWSAVDFKDQ